MKSWVRYSLLISLIAEFSALTAKAERGVDKAEFSFPPSVMRGVRHVMALDQRLAVSTGRDVRFYGVDNQAPLMVGASNAWMTAIGDDVLVVSPERLLICDQVGRVKKTFAMSDAQPVFSVDKEVVALLTLKARGSRLSFLDKRYEIAKELDFETRIYPLVLDVKKMTFLSAMQPHVAHRENPELQLWEGNKLVADLTELYPGARLLATASSGRLYLAVPTGANDSVVLALDWRGKKVWQRDVSRDAGLIRMSVIAGENNGKDIGLLSCENSSSRARGVVSQYALDALTGVDLKMLKDVTPDDCLVSPDGKYALAGDPKDVYGVNRTTGKTLWRMSQDAYWLGTSRSILATTIVDRKPHAISVHLVVAEQKTEGSPGRTMLFARDIKKGALVHELSFEGTEWKLYVSSGGVAWVASAQGKGYRIPLAK